MGFSIKRIGKDLKHGWNKHKREILGVITGGGSEFLREFSGYNQMKAMEGIAKEQAKIQQKQLELAQQQAYTDAGNQINVSNAGEKQALARALAKRTAMQRSIRTQGQQRFGD